MAAGTLGSTLVWVGLLFALLTMGAYIAALFVPNKERQLRYLGRALYMATAASVLSTMATLGWIVYNRMYLYDYAVHHTGNDITNGWYRFAATWSGQEGSFLLWASWTAIIGVMVFLKAGKYEARVMPFFVLVIAFLCGILAKQSPFVTFAVANPLAHMTPLDGSGLTPSLQNYWMTIHPPTIFFGFASLAVPYAYAMAALIWKDYKGWTTRVMPYALLTCATLGLGLFMGGYWAYETQGWHGFWAWDPVENASFFPWLAITALVHGLVVQKSRGGMARSNTFLGIFAFWLFLLGTFLTRSGALSSHMGGKEDGQLLSVHAFDNISKSGLILMTAMLVGYGLAGLILWLIRAPKMPSRPTTGDSLLSRDFAFFMAILLMVVACVVVTLGSTTPLLLSWAHRPPSQPQPTFYNKVMMPLAILTAFMLGCVPWVAWRKTDPEKFLRKLLVPWFFMLGFGFFLFFWVLHTERSMANTVDPEVMASTLHHWLGASMQRVLVVVLSSLGFLAALSNAMLAYKVLRVKPLSAGGWIAHVGIGVLMIGVIVSNTYEQTTTVTLKEGDGPREAFGYKISYEGMTGTPLAGRPLDPEFDIHNSVQLRVSPPGADEHISDGSVQTFLLEPRWFVNRPTVPQEADHSLENMTWPSIRKYLDHDLYVGFANYPTPAMYQLTLSPGEHQQVGPYDIFYVDGISRPQDYFGAELFIKTEDGKVIKATPGLQFLKDPETGKMVRGANGPVLFNVDEAVPELKDDHGVSGTLILESLQAGTHQAQILVSLPGAAAKWKIPLAVTYKPWVNLVWIGVLITVMGTLLAMVRRMLEARRADDEYLQSYELRLEGDNVTGE